MLSSATGLEISGQSVGFAGKTLAFNADLSAELAGGSPGWQSVGVAARQAAVRSGDGWGGTRGAGGFAFLDFSSRMGG